MGTAYQELHLPGGIACVAPAGERAMTGFVLREQGDWFEAELAFLRGLVQPGWRCVDVGASSGCYALTMAMLSGPAGAVLAVEPHPVQAEALRRGQALLSRAAPLRIAECAVAADEGNGTLSDPEHPELSELVPDGPVPVRVVTLDGLTRDLGGIDLLKIDVEGGGAAALAGAGRILREGRSIIQFAIQHGGQHQARSCFQLMETGHVLYRLVPGLGVLAPLLPGEALDAFAINAFAVPSARLPALQAGGKAIGVIDGHSPLPQGVAVQAIIDRLAAAPWIARFSPAWQPNSILAGWDHQRRAVAMQVLAEDSALGLAERAACLHQAQQAIAKALQAAATVPRLLTALRIMAARGARGEAVRAIESLMPAVKRGDDELRGMIAEPYLLPLSTHEALPFATQTDMVRCAILEAAAFLPTYSAFFTGAGSLPLYERICQLPVHSPRADRVLAMLRALNQRKAAVPLRL